MKTIATLVVAPALAVILAVAACAHTISTSDEPLIQTPKIAVL
jgi:hypothetical protein